MAFIASGCGDGNKHHVDLSGHEVEIKIDRLEDDLFTVGSTDDYLKLDQIDSSLMRAFKRGIMGPETRDGFLPPEESAAGFMRFTSNKDMRHLYHSVDSAFPDLGEIEEELSLAFSHYNYYFPNAVIPKFYSVVTPFRAHNITTEKAMAICLDMYLGPDFTPYQSPMLNFPNYLVKRFRPDYMVPNVVKAWVESDLERGSGDRLLDEMIFQGKILYALDLLMPDLPDSLKIGYPNGKIEWCVQNEFQIWSHLIDENLLYSSDYRSFSGVISDGPFSKGNNVPQESPPRVAVWAGWQIVREYMEKHPETTLKELLASNDSEAILHGSGYKP
ncbi:MAG: hypothetical protein JJ975_10135 [Bacteroidia bacterium]|nr:hypothetical protein [Bacteroidia bacterium]